VIKILLVFFFSLQRVAIGTLQHLLPIGIGLLFSIGFIYYSKKYFSIAQQQKALHRFALVISFSVVAFHLYYIGLGNYDLTTDLPLYLCSLLAIIIPVFTHYRKYWMYEILLFWIIAGTLQGIFTPDIAEGFPSLDYFRYWMVHLGLLIVIFYTTIVFGMRPKFKSIFKSFFALQVYLLLIIGINYMLDANYFYLNEKPKSASILDFLGEWPVYIIVGQLILIPYFMIIYLPFYFTNKYSEKPSN
jgi:hypothetical integral membrane protein (TIGR02206 family)